MHRSPMMHKCTLHSLSPGAASRQEIVARMECNEIRGNSNSDSAALHPGLMFEVDSLPFVLDMTYNLIVQHVAQ